MGKNTKRNKKMKKEQLIQALQGYDYLDLIKEQYGKHNLSIEEVQMINGEVVPYYQVLTVEEFANMFEGDTLSIYYKNGLQVGFVRLSSNNKHSLFPLRTFQNIMFDVEHPDNGIISFDLNSLRK